MRLAGEYWSIARQDSNRQLRFPRFNRCIVPAAGPIPGRRSADETDGGAPADRIRSGRVTHATHRHHTSLFTGEIRLGLAKSAWDWLVLLLVIYVAVSTPYVAAFLSVEHRVDPRPTESRFYVPSPTRYPVGAFLYPCCVLAPALYALLASSDEY